MNRNDKKRVIKALNTMSSICEILEDAKNKVEELYEELEGQRDFFSDLADAEQEKFDNLPEGLQESERGQNIAECAEKLESISEDIDTLLGDLDDILENECLQLDDIIENITELV